MRHVLIVLIGLFLFATVPPELRAQDPEAVLTPCQILENPEAFNGKMIRVRGGVSVSFENFTLDTSHCKPDKNDWRIWIWLEYGSGPEKHPTIWCCGNIDPRKDEIAVVQNQDFRKFYEYVGAMNTKSGCGDCYRYDVTATLTGRLDYGERELTNPDGQKVMLGRFGHMGMSELRLVIQSVSDLAVKDYRNACAPDRCICEGRQVTWSPERKAVVRLGDKEVKSAEVYRNAERPEVLLVSFDWQTILVDLEHQEVMELGFMSYYLDVSRGEGKKLLVWDTGEDSNSPATSRWTPDPKHPPDTAGCRWSKMARVESDYWIVRDNRSTREISFQLGIGRRPYKIRVPLLAK